MPSSQSHSFSISIVSHGHKNFILLLLDDLVQLGRNDFEVILTWNLKNEDTAISEHSFPFKLTSIVNPLPLGFAQNHNAAFKKSDGENFVILNPDIRLPKDPFTVLLSILHTTPDAICAPLIVNSHYEQEDSARFFPSPFFLLKKAVAKALGAQLPAQRVPNRNGLLSPDWIAGMFMLIPRHIYNALGGLSERYYLYYEDVDFCARAHLRNIDILVTKDVAAIHDARRESHRDLRFLRWHMRSAARFFTSRVYLQIKLRNLFNYRRL